MSLAIKHGLFKLNLTDYHAILGVSLEAEPKQIRLSYLKIAQKLHPDKCRQNPQKMKLAGQILSKLVNPAYEQLSRKSNFAEHQLVLTQIGKRLAENKDKLVLTTEAAQELIKAGDSAELVYRKLLKKLALDQYKSIESVAKNIGDISELNLVYLMLQCDRVAGKAKARKIGGNPNNLRPSNKNNSAAKPNQELNKQTINQSKSTTSQKSAAAKKPTKAEEPSTDSRVNAFVGRAQQYIAKKEFDRAVTELRDALRIDPNHAVAHAVMGQAYLQKNQLTMAKVHISKACKAEPTNTIVIESQKALDKLTKKSNTNKVKKGDSNSNGKSSNSGFFSGFFGTKKK